jgi:hypothetical protein
MSLLQFAANFIKIFLRIIFPHNYKINRHAAKKASLQKEKSLALRGAVK